jgi:predicted phage terminase large subunit-like protein
MTDPSMTDASKTDPHKADPQMTDLTSSLYRFASVGLGYDRINVDEHGYILNMLSNIYAEWLAKKQSGIRTQTVALILLPRGSFKTTIASVSFPMWMAQQNPNIRVLIDSETYNLSKCILSEIKQQYEVGPYTQYFKAIDPKDAVRWAEDSIIMPGRDKPFKEGTFNAAGLDGVKAGMHYDMIIADDLHSQNNVRNQYQIDQVIEHYRLLMPILETDGILIVIGTRWGTDDAYNVVMQDVDSNHNLFIPATSIQPMNVASRRRVLEQPSSQPPTTTSSQPPTTTSSPPVPADTCASSIPPNTRLTYNGDIKDCVQATVFFENFPHTLPQEYLDKAERRQGPYVYSAQYLLHPVASKEKRFREEWIQFYVEDPTANPSDYPLCRPPLLSHEMFRRIGIIDPAFTTQDYSDPSGIVILAVSGNRDIYVKYAEEHTVEPPDLINLIFELNELHGVDQWFVEEVAAQRVLRFYMEYMATHEDKRICLNPVKSGGKKKDLRIMSLQPFFQNKKIWMHEDQATLLGQYRRFPILKHDDVLDALAYAPQVVYDGIVIQPYIPRPEGVTMNDLIDEMTQREIPAGIRPMLSQTEHVSFTIGGGD